MLENIKKSILILLFLVVSIYLMKHQIINDIEQKDTVNYKGETNIIMNEEKIKSNLDEKANNIPLWDNTEKNELQIFSSEVKNDKEIVINSNFLKMKKINGFDDKSTLFYIPSIFTGTEFFSINKKGEIKSYLRTGKYIFMSEPSKIDNNHYIWIANSSEARNMTTLVCTDKNLNFLWDYSYDTRQGHYDKPVYTLENEGFITLEANDVINFFDENANLIWEYELPKETKNKRIFVVVIENNIDIYIADMKLTLNLAGELIDKKIFPYLFLQVIKSEKFTYYNILDNIKREKTADGLSYDLILNDAQNYLLRENNKSKEKTKINYVAPNNNGELIVVNDYCFYQSQLGGGKWELAIISQDKISSISIPSNMAIKPILIDENIQLCFESYLDDKGICKEKKILLDKNGNIISENEIELDADNMKYLHEVFEMDSSLYKVEKKEIFNPKRKADVMFWQFIISLY